MILLRMSPSVTKKLLKWLLLTFKVFNWDSSNTIKYKSTSMIAVLIVVYAWQLSNLNPVLVATFVIVIRTHHILGIDPGEASVLW